MYAFWMYKVKKASASKCLVSAKSSEKNQREFIGVCQYYIIQLFRTIIIINPALKFCTAVAAQMYSIKAAVILFTFAQVHGQGSGLGQSIL